MEISGAFLVVQTKGHYWHPVGARNVATHASWNTQDSLHNNYLAQNGKGVRLGNPDLVNTCLTGSSCSEHVTCKAPTKGCWKVSRFVSF